jgi:hypothetical protein
MSDVPAAAPASSLSGQHLDLISVSLKAALRDPDHQLHLPAKALKAAMKMRVDAEAAMTKAGQHYADVLRLALAVSNAVKGTREQLNAAIEQDADKLISAGLRSIDALLAVAPAAILTAIERRYKSLTDTSRRLAEYSMPCADRDQRLADIASVTAEGRQFAALGEFIERLSAEAAAGILALEGTDAAIEIKSGLSSLCLANAKRCMDEAAGKEREYFAWVKGREEQGLRLPLLR